MDVRESLGHKKSSVVKSTTFRSNLLLEETFKSYKNAGLDLHSGLVNDAITPLMSEYSQGGVTCLSDARF